METLRTTNLDSVGEGDQVNVERSFQVGDEIGGHVLSGHVTGVAELLERRVSGHDHVMTLNLNTQWARYVFHKGFIALDGASLTVSTVDREAQNFTISLIPETLSRTTLGSLETGQTVNVEVDSQSVTTVDTVERLFADPHWRAQMLATHT